MHFLWGVEEGHHKLVFKNWDSFCLPRKEGGVNIKEILSWNKTQLMIWIRKLELDSNTIWAEWVKAYLLKGKSIWEFQVTTAHSWGIHNIVSCKDSLIEHAGSLERTRSLLCKHDFKKQIYKLLRPKGASFSAYKTLGDPLNFPEHIVIGLLAAQDKLAALDNICKRGFLLANRCALCYYQAESRNHLFFECAFSSEVWQAITQWLKIPAITGFSRLIRWFKACNCGVSRAKRLFKVASLAFLVVKHRILYLLIDN
ncbi:uncharacterized protein LOC141628077 [Silene latifolia]|uniref:uncharacterized protein LOC141628077 n=1 Tax=Silene latifolia TaxID=37657 RepID=UPI003D7701D7